jgi:carnosine N-methyltransferase
LTSSLRYVCPVCRAGFATQDGFYCADCNVRYPVIRGMPVLCPAPYRHLGEEALRIVEYRQSNRAHGQTADPDSMSLDDVCDKLTDAITPLLTVRSVLATAAARSAKRSRNPYSPVQSLYYLHRDWSGALECEEEIQDITQAALKALDKAGGERSRILLLGAGTGRFASVLAPHFASTHAMELSVPMGLLRDFLRDGPLRFTVLDRRNRRSEDDARQRHTASSLGVDLDSVEWVIADALSCPYPDGYFSTVASLYFSDVVPARRLLSEVARILAPGGTFVHVGPLGYQFDLPADDIWPAERWPVEVEKFGLRAVYTDWARSTHHVDASSMFTTLVDNFVLACEKRV